MKPEKTNNIKTNVEILKLLQHQANKSAKQLLTELNIPENHSEYAAIKYGLTYDIYSSLKRNLNIQSEY